MENSIVYNLLPQTSYDRLAPSKYILQAAKYASTYSYRTKQLNEVCH